MASARQRTLRNKRKAAKRKWQRVVEVDQDQRCALCGHKHQLTLHHLLAISDEGENVRSNIVGLCKPCHLFWHGFGEGCMDSAWKPLPIFTV